MLNCSLLSYATEADGQLIVDNVDLVSESTSGWLPDVYERLSPTSDIALYSLDSSYDPREEGFFTEPKDQGSTDLCWMYATSGTIEHYVSKTFGSKFDISEAHGAVALSNSVLPASNSNGVGYYNNIANFGGNTAKALQYFTNWNTPIFSDNVSQWNSTVADDLFPVNIVSYDSITSINDAFTNAESLFNVTSAHYLSIHGASDVKEAILNYGGVITGITNITSPREGADGELNFFSTSNIGISNTGHAIMLVGWDDNYSKDNFIYNKPTIDGAWLVKNSYYDSSYYWVSYQEGSLKIVNNNVGVITGVQKASDNEYMLSYDYFIPAYKKTILLLMIFICVIFLIYQAIQIHMIKLKR